MLRLSFQNAKSKALDIWYRKVRFTRGSLDSTNYFLFNKNLDFGSKASLLLNILQKNNRLATYP